MTSDEAEKLVAAIEELARETAILSEWGLAQREHELAVKRRENARAKLISMLEPIFVGGVVKVPGQT